MRHPTLAILLLAAAAPGLAQQPTVQVQYDAATALDATGTADQRLAAWSALEARAGSNKRSRAIMRVRKSSALLALGRRDEAAAAASAGLADLPAGDASLAEDRFNAQMELGLIAEAGLDFSSAAARFQLADAIAPDKPAHVSALVSFVRTATFVDPDAALAAVGRADAAMAFVKADVTVQALLRRYHAELLLNRGDLAGAKVQAGQAVKLLGGLTDKVRLEDVSSRSDYAIAALLSGDRETAREYLAYTGAGRLPANNLGPALKMDAPDCGGEAGLKPSDVAVVEFAVADDGSVADNRPVYAAGGGRVALEFANAVGAWSWAPEKVKPMPPFFRRRIRMEMRCSTAFVRPSISDFLDVRLTHWLGDKGVEASPTPTGSDAGALPGERARLAELERKAGPDALALVPVLRSLATNQIVGREETHGLAERALAILVKNGAVGVPRLAMEWRVWGTAKEDRARYFRDEVPAQITAHYPDDAEARGAATLMIADAVARSPDRVRPKLQQVADDAALAKDSPVRVAALVRLASLEQQAGKPDAARTAFQQSGLSADQCALIDSPPRRLSASASFPLEAARWGFEGWTQVQYDVRADGKVINERAVVAYPPFVFSQAGQATFAGARYAKSFRPSGELGCGGETGRVRFVLPH